MLRRFLALILLSLPLLARAAPVDPVQALLAQARLWQSLERPVEAQQALDKLARLHAVAPAARAEALTLQALVQIQQHRDAEVTRTLTLLRQRYPGYGGIARVEVMRRIAGPDQGKLLMARSLFNSGKINEAYAAFNALYRGTPPEGPLALEYWQLVARLPGDGWERAHRALGGLVRDNPSNHGARLALASIYLLHPPVPSAVLADLAALSQFNDSRSDALGLWRRALLQVDGEIPLAAYRTYLRLAPDDTQISEKLTSLAERQRKERELLADPAYRALLAAGRALDANRPDEAERGLRLAAARYGKRPDYLLALGRLREKQGRYAEAIATYRRGQAADSEAGDWPRRIAAAELAALLADAGRAMDAGRWPLAQSLLDRAARRAPDDPAVLVARADWYDRQHRPEAETWYRRALARDPGNREALAGLMQGYLRAGRFDAARALLAQMPPAQRQAQGAAYRSALAAVERAAGDRLVAAGKLDEALPHLQRAVDAAPDDAWNRFALANAWLAAGDAARGRQVLAQLADGPRADADSLYAYALFLARTDDGAAALDRLGRIAPSARTDGMRALQHRVWLTQVMALADGDMATGRFAAARRVLTAAETAAGDDGALLGPIADGWVRAGDAEHARTLLAEAWRRAPGEDTGLALLEQLIDQRDAPGAARLAAQLATRPLSADAAGRLAGLHGRLSVLQADLADARGDRAAALGGLTAALARQPDDARLIRNLAALELRDGRVPVARARLERLLARTPDDDEARLLLSDAEAAAGDHRAAAGILSALLVAEPPRSLDFRLRVLDRLDALGEGDRVDRELTRLARNANPPTPGLAGLAARRSLAHGQPAAALDWYRRGFAPAADPDDGGNAAAPAVALLPVAAEDARREDLHEQYAALLDRQTVTIWQGLDLTYRPSSSGTPGQSQMTMLQAPLLIETPAPGDGRFSLRADAVTLDAGSLVTSDSYARRRFGAIASIGGDAGQIAAAAAAGKQHDAGTSIAAGYANARWQVDIGTTPQGFAVSYPVGGIKYSGDAGQLYYNVEASRRPVTSSLLSYAGTRDPVTGTVWGGVRATGSYLGIGYDQGGAYGVWTKFGYHELTGQNVADNSRVSAMGGIYWRLVKEAAREVTVGVNSINFWYRRNLGGYTLGQGGYYSPQRYHSLSLPVSYAARNERTSYVLRASVSVSSAREEAAPFFPTRPDLQAAAGNPQVSVSAGPGWGASLSGAVEYQLTSRVALGAWLQYQYSQFYQPGRAMLYLRYQPDGAARPLSLPVEPLQSYSDF